jgi:hypothetical protein
MKFAIGINGAIWRLAELSGVRGAAQAGQRKKLVHRWGRALQSLFIESL